VVVVVAVAAAAAVVATVHLVADGRRKGTTLRAPILLNPNPATQFATHSWPGSAKNERRNGVPIQGGTHKHPNNPILSAPFANAAYRSRIPYTARQKIQTIPYTVPTCQTNSKLHFCATMGNFVVVSFIHRCQRRPTIPSCAWVRDVSKHPLVSWLYVWKEKAKNHSLHGTQIVTVVM
jgi:hypothetical protein